MRIGKTTIAIIFVSFCLTLLFVFSAAAQTKPSSRILFVPLDDRPPTYQWILKMGEIGDAEVVSPPRKLLGKFTEFGNSDQIIEWLKTQDLTKFDAAIVSVDMLAYGGLVAMREFETDASTARKRLDFIREMKRRAPLLKIYASSVIMRLAPTGNVVNEAYRENLAKWAEMSVDEARKAETAALEQKIPADALKNYKLARERDLQLNLASIDLIRDKVIEQLILGQDDAKPKGVHVADRERLLSEIKAAKLEQKIGVQPGADELSMLQLARVLSDKYAYRPKIKVVYSSEKIREQVMPYEDRPLHQTVSFQIRSIGAVEVQTEKECDIIFYVYASRNEPGRAESFAEQIRAGFNVVNGDRATVKPNAKKFIIADVDPKGDIQGGDRDFTEALLVKLVFFDADGYAAWNTAGNTVGTALPHGLIVNLSRKRSDTTGIKKPLSMAEREKRRQTRKRITRAHTWFLLNRLLDDYVYHSLVRPDLIKSARAEGWNVFRLNDEQTATLEPTAGRKLEGQTMRLLNYISPLSDRFWADLSCGSVKNFVFDLPWNRTFEAELEYELVCEEF